MSRKSKNVVKMQPAATKSEADQAMQVVVPAQATATRYAVRILVGPAEPEARGAQIDVMDPRLEVGSFATASELAWALAEALQAVTELFAKHHGEPSDAPAPPAAPVN